LQAGQADPQSIATLKKLAAKKFVWNTYACRRAVIQSLIEVRRPEAVTALVACLPKLDGEVRGDVVQFLEEISGERNGLNAQAHDFISSIGRRHRTTAPFHAPSRAWSQYFPCADPSNWHAKPASRHRQSPGIRPPNLAGLAHLRRILKAYFECYHHSRTHLSLERNSPIPREIEPPCCGKVRSIPQLGVLHHRYTRAA
jgi:hypothetical protein